MTLPAFLEVDAKHRFGTFELDASFRSQGGITALFGRSGSGKTSLMRIIAGLERPSHARIVVGGEVMVDTRAGIFVPKHRRRLGFVFQEARLFPHFSVRQNLNYGRWFSLKRNAGSSFDQVVDLLGIEHLLERNPARLSGGEKQRVAIGRALLSSPRLLLMDEPLAALDEERKQEILPYLERLRDENATPIIYVSHAINEVARLADTVVMMRDGRAAATGTPADVLGSLAPGLREERDGGAVLSGVVSAVDAPHRLVTVTVGAFEVSLPAVDSEPGRQVRIFVPERDVMIATERPRGLSALNIIGGEISALQEAGEGAVRVQVRCGAEMLFARITRLSAERLSLQPGMRVFAVLKTIALER